MSVGGHNVSTIMTSKMREVERVDSKVEFIDGKHDYDPYDHPPKESATTYGESLLIYLKSSIGTGILSLPRSFLNAGYMVGLIGTFVIGIVTTHTVHILISAEYDLSKRKRVPNMSYPEIAEAALEYGPKRVRKYKHVARWMCQMMLLSDLMGSCCIYAIFIADNLKQEIDNLYQPMDIRVIIACLLMPLILLSLMRDLKVLSTLASIGNVCLIFCYGIIFYYIFSGTPKVAERKPIGTITGISLAFGTVLFSMGAIPVVVPLKNGMARPKQFTTRFGVLNVSMVIIAILYCAIGLFGYLQYGEETEATISLNMPQNNLSGHAVKLLLCAMVYVSFGVLDYFTCDVIWSLLPAEITKSPNKLFYQYIVKVSSVLVIFVLSMVIPNLELFLGLLGSLSVANLLILFPIIIETLTFWDKLTGLRFYLFLLKNICLFTIAIFCCAIAVGSSCTEIYHRLILPLFL